MRKYGCLQAILKSFYARDLYQDAVENWRFGSVILYLLLLVSAFSIYMTVDMQKAVNMHYDNFSRDVYPQLPNITIKNGELTTLENRPYLLKIKSFEDDIVYGELTPSKEPPSSIKNKKVSKEYVFGIIDTSGKYQNLDGSSAVLLITKKAFYYRNQSTLSKLHEFSSDSDREIRPIDIDSFFKKIVHCLWIIFFLAMLGLVFIILITQVAVFAIIGEIFAYISKVPLPYGGICKIGVFALTPPFVLQAIMSYFHIQFPYMTLCYYVLFMVYIWFGILANKKR